MATVDVCGRRADIFNFGHSRSLLDDTTPVIQYKKKEMNMPVGKSKKIYNVSRYCIKTLRSCQLDAIIHLKKKKNVFKHLPAHTRTHKLT